MPARDPVQDPPLAGLDALPEPPAPRGDLSGYVPPPRFGRTRFADYRPAHESQAVARETVARFAADAARASRPPRPWRPWRPWGAWRPPSESRGLYLDGGFGVGKTHLLAAAWHDTPLPARAKRYLSFQELVHLQGVLGREGAREAFADVSLLCLDEFELDDPGSTLLIATFLREAFARGTTVLTTSNTPPAAQGEGRFAADDFRRQIHGIADRFDVLRIDGPDHRADGRRARWNDGAELARAAAAPGTVVRTGGADLTATLARLHPVRYRPLLARVDVLLIDRVEPLPDQNAALRFVHFVDKLYDLGVGLRATGATPLDALFDPSYRDGAYAAKHRRCVSRLGELLREPLPADRAGASAS